MKKIMMIMVLGVALVFTTPAQAETAKVSVLGLVCDFCAQGLTKVFGREDAVKSVDVNLTTKFVTVDFKDGKTMPDEKIKQLITDSGFTVVKIERTT